MTGRGPYGFRVMGFWCLLGFEVFFFFSSTLLTCWNFGVLQFGVDGVTVGLWMKV